ncbi:hypothetical protein [Rhodopila sp.]
MALHEEWSENPPTHLILAAVHMARKSKVKGDPADLLNVQEGGTVHG